MYSRRPAFVIVVVFLAIARRSAGPEGSVDSLQRAKRLAWLNNWAEASRVLEELKRSGRLPTDEATALFYRAVEIRTNIESLSFPSAAEELATMLSSEAARNQPELRLQILAMKGDIEFQYDLPAAEMTWNEVRRMAADSRDSRSAARAEGKLGDIAFLKGQILTAMTMVSKAYIKAEINGDITGKIEQLTALGEGLAEFGRRADAIRFYNKALTLWSQNRDSYFPFTAYVGKARLLLNTDRSNEAKRMLVAGLDEARRDRMRVRETRILTALGDDAIRAGDRKAGIKWLTAGAQIAHDAGLDRIEADIGGTLASVLSDAGDFAEAATYAQSSVAACERAGDKYHLAERLAALAEIEAHRGDLAAAESSYAQASRVINSLFADLPNLRYENTVVATMGRVFQGHFELALNGFHDIDRAFEILESGRARGLADKIRQHQFPKPIDGPRDPVMLHQIADVNRRLVVEQNAARRSRLLDILWEDEVKSLQIGRSNLTPELPPEARPISLAQLQAILGEDDLLIEYVLGPAHSFALTIARDKCVPYELVGRKQIESSITEYLRAIQNRRDSHTEAAELYRLLLGPITLLRQHKRLIIVSDATTDKVPFGAAVDPQGRYLMETHVISYAPSATTFVLLSRAKPVREKPVELLGIGGATYGSLPRDSALSQLRGGGLFSALAAPEFSRLDHSFTEVVDLPSDRDWDTHLLTGDDATEANLKGLALSGYRVLHFALHSAIDREFPDRSGLIFTSGSKDGDDDVLQAREIMGLKLNADLVTLSACEGAAGTAEGFAGTNSLVESFLIAGARSVVASIWEADDAFTAGLMRRFYANLRVGLDKAEALTVAEREMLKLYGPNDAPLYWAGFRIVGDDRGKLSEEGHVERTH
jgi:CHAT domain-containing protein